MARIEFNRYQRVDFCKPARQAPSLPGGGEVNKRQAALCQFFLGKRGEGKTVTLLRNWIDGPLLGKTMPACASVTFDPKGTLALAMVGHAVARGKEELVLYDRARDVERVLRWLFAELPP